MKHIGILSDTHSHIDRAILDFFSNCNEIWHAGDIGNSEVADMLENNFKLIAVHGNIDDYFMKIRFPMHQRFLCENMDVWLTHIGGYPGHYAPAVFYEISKNPPKLFICGHSHILKVIHDDKLDLLHINPGAAGISGQHQVRTAIRLVIDGNNIKDLEILELKR